MGRAASGSAISGVIASVILAGALAGCSSQDFLPRTVENKPAPSVGTLKQQVLEGVTVTWPEHGHRLLVSTIGSSSCPIVPFAFTDDDRALVLKQDAQGSDVCSADLTPTTASIRRPANWTPSVRLAAEIADSGEITIRIMTS